MIDLKVAIRSLLIADPELFALIGDRVYPCHISGVKNPVYPCITQGRDGGGMIPSLLATSAEIHIDVWSKTGNDEMYAVYKRVYALLNLKPIPVTSGQVFRSKETYMNDNLFEQKTFTYHLASRYNILSR